MDLKLSAVDIPSRASVFARAEHHVAGSGLIVGGFGCVLIATLGLVHGGYFPTAWGWGALVTLWVAFLALVISERVRLGPLEIMFLAGLTAFLAVVAASSIWSIAPPAAIRELERGVLVLGAVLAAMLLARRHMRPLLGGVLAGITIAAAYGLATRLFPSQLGSSFDPISGYRLDEPLGYWNAFGLFAALGTLLAVGFAARGRTIAARAFGSALPIVLLPTLYFTFSRGAWAALAIGLTVALAMDRHRLQLATTILGLGPLVAIALWFSASEPDLNRRAAGLAGAASEGRRLAFILIALSIAAAFVGPALHIADERIRFSTSVRRAFGGVLAAALLAAVGAGVYHFGGPQHVATRTWDAFNSRPISVSNSGNLNQRLFSLSATGRLTQWRVAIDDYRAHPWLGSGAGTYEYSWLRERPRGSWHVRDAHNLYVEVLAELGPAGLGLLLLTVSVPILAVVRVRRHPLVPVAFGAYVAFLIHAATDWDWEMPAVTIAGLLCGVAVMIVARRNADGRFLTRPIRIAAAGGAVVLAAFAFVGLMGNLAIAASNNAASSGNWNESARRARDAKRWMPWASDPWRLEGEAQYVLHQDAAARVNFRKAIAKDPNNWLVWADLATVSPHGAWRVPARRALELNPLAPQLGDFRQALGVKG